MEKKSYDKFNAFSLNMKHDVTASINKYLCFINNIKHYSNYMYVYNMMLKGCGNAFVMFVLFCARSVPMLLTPLCLLIFNRCKMRVKNKNKMWLNVNTHIKSV